MQVRQVFRFSRFFGVFGVFEGDVVRGFGVFRGYSEVHVVLREGRGGRGV